MSSIPKKAKTILIAVLTLGLLIGGFLFAPPQPHVQVSAEKLWDVAGFPITNTVFTAWIVMAILIVIALLVRRNVREVPTGLQNFVEMVLEFLLDMVNSAAGEKRGRKLFPLIATIFLFLLLSNWSGLLPFVGTFTINSGLPALHGSGNLYYPILRSPSTDLNLTIGLAIISVVAIQMFSIRALGTGGYLSKFFNFHGPINFFVGFLELIGEISKIISLSFRLFGNIFAGEVLLGVIGFLVPWIASIPFLGLEIFIGAIQAYIFAVLTLIFTVVGSASHDGAHESSSGGSH